MFYVVFGKVTVYGDSRKFGRSSVPRIMLRKQTYFDAREPLKKLHAKTRANTRALSPAHTYTQHRIDDGRKSERTEGGGRGGLEKPG